MAEKEDCFALLCKVSCSVAHYYFWLHRRLSLISKNSTAHAIREEYLLFFLAPLKHFLMEARISHSFPWKFYALAETSMRKKRMFIDARGTEEHLRVVLFARQMRNAFRENDFLETSVGRSTCSSPKQTSQETLSRKRNKKAFTTEAYNDGR